MPNIGDTKWGSSQALGTSGGVVTWSLVGANVGGVRDAFGEGTTVSFTSDDTVAAQSVLNYSATVALRQAFDAWSRHADITFVQIADGGENFGDSKVADIRIGFGEIDGANGGTVGVGYFPGRSGIAGDILFDSDEIGFFSSRFNFLSVATHEIGHAIGLEHVTGVEALMNPVVGNTAVPLSDDIQGVRRIYGPDQGEGGVINLGARNPDINILNTVEGLIVNGTRAGNIFDGGGGAELVRGRAGDDDLLGAGGDDTLLGMGDRDLIAGEGGGDNLSGGDAADNLFGGAGRDRVSGDKGFDRLLGDGGNDTLFGGVGDDRMFGGAGRDRMSGDGGADLMFGGAEADSLLGGAGDDTIIGGGGGDRIVGGAGFDILTGGGGPDRFIFEDNSGRDRITDFQDGVDKINFKDVTGVSAFGQLTIFNQGDNAIVKTNAGVTIVLLDTDAGSLDGSDFIF